MNAKKCKALRRRARELTVGAPVRRYEVLQGITRLHPGCTRGVYKAMKKEAT